MSTASLLALVTAAMLSCGFASGCAAATEEEVDTGEDAIRIALAGDVVGVRAVNPAGKQTIGNPSRIKKILTAGGFRGGLARTQESCFSGTNLVAMDAKGEEKARVDLCGGDSDSAILTVGGKSFKTTYLKADVDRELGARRTVKDVLFGTYTDLVVFKKVGNEPMKRGAVSDARKVTAILAAIDLDQGLGPGQPLDNDPTEPPPPNVFEGCTTFSFLLQKSEPFQIDVITECGGKSRARLIATGIGWHEEHGISVKSDRLESAIAQVKFSPLER
jgi:hypothetical protein